mmetsp:Transcript_396/g.588  ORF Transcript_396/g.588 Transcript_396/m.588 type:complete len:476 (+) Transcript_396:159-1586(+)
MGIVLLLVVWSTLCFNVPPLWNSTDESDEDSIRQIFVLHRHGVRSPANMTENGDLIYTSTSLTPLGKSMMKALGKFLRKRYGKILSEHWDPFTMSARSTDFDRTRNSATLLLQSLFPPEDFPDVKVSPVFQDDLLLIKPPAVRLRNPTLVINRKCDIEAQETFSKESMGDIARMTNISEAVCFKHPGTCVRLAADAAACEVAERDEITVASSSYGRNYEKLLRFLRRNLHYHAILIGINPDATSSDGQFRRKIGSLGYSFLSHVLKIAKNNLGSCGQHFHEYSAHDVTLVAIYGAMGILRPGNYESPLNSPMFGEAVAIEVSKKGKIQVHRMIPHRVSNGFSYRSFQIHLPCFSTEGHDSLCEPPTVYSWLTQLEQTSAPKSPDGLCYADPAGLLEHRCTELNTFPGPECAHFRLACPLQGCPPGSVVHPSDRRCLPVQGRIKPHGDTVFVLSVVGSGVLGAVLGALGSYSFLRR